MSQSQNISYYLGSVKVKHFIDANNARLGNIGYPVLDTDAATKKYVDDNIVSFGLVAGSGITINGDTISVNNSLTHVTAIGNINTGTWSANTINVPYGGTGKSNFSPNKLIMGDGTNPLVSISELSFQSNIFQSTCPILISNTSESIGLGSGGSFTTLGGASVSGKVFVGGDLSVSSNASVLGSVTMGNVVINGSCNVVSVSGTNANYTNSTVTNSVVTNITNSNVLSTNQVSTNITSSNILSTNLRLTNLTSSNLICTFVTNSNLLTTNISSSTLRVNNGYVTDLVSTNISTTTLSTPQINTTSIVLTNLVGSNLNISTSLTSPSILSTYISTTTINSTNGSITSLTTNNLVVNSSSILGNVTTNNVYSNNITSSSLTTTNITSTNLITTNITTSNIGCVSGSFTNLTSSNFNTFNITSSGLVVTNITVSNISSQNLISSTISSSNLRISGMSIVTTVNAYSISSGQLHISNIANMANTIVTNITNTNLVNTNSSVSNLNVSNITTSNLFVRSISTLGSVGSVNLSTGQLYSSTTAFLNNEVVNNSSIANLRVTDVNCVSLTTANISINNNLFVSILNSTTQTTTNLLVTNVRGTNITTVSLQVTGTSIFGTVNSSVICTGSLYVSAMSSYNDIFATNITVQNIQNTNITSSNIDASFVNIRQRLDLGSNFSGAPSSSSGNMLNITPYYFTDSTTLENGIVPFWTTNLFSSSTLSAQNTVTTQKASNVYISGSPVVGPNQTIENLSALAIGYVNNQTGGNISGQIILERNDGEWYGSIFTESSTNRVVIANASLSGGGGVGLYTYKGTKITFADVTTPTNFTPSAFLEFSNETSKFYSSTDSISKTSGSVVILGGMGVGKNITCSSITPDTINASISKLQDVDINMVPTNGQSLVWNGSKWTSMTISGGGGGGSSGPTSVNVYPMSLVMPVMTSNGPEAGENGNYYVSASSEFSSLYQAYKCLSSVTNPSDWSTAGENSNFWIKVRLPSSQNVRYVLLEGRINNEDPTTITIQGSNDDVTYTDIYTNQDFTALNYTGYFSANIPENSKDYTYYKFLFPTGSGVNSGLNMLRLFKYDDTTYTEGILDNSSLEGNGYFNSAITNGRWPMAFTLNATTIVNIRAQITCYTPSAYVLRKFVMYIDGAPFQNGGSTFVKQLLQQNLHTSLQTLEWTGTLTSGVHTISFFVDGGTGVVFDTNDNIRVNVVKY